MLYLAALFAVWGLMRFTGDRWWLGTVLLFSPRWIFALPLIVLAPLAALWRRRMLGIALGAAVLWIGPIAGFQMLLPLRATPTGAALRVLTCNVQGVQLNERALAAIILKNQVDILALQEFEVNARLDWLPGWHVCRIGPLVIASRFPLSGSACSKIVHPRQKWPWINAMHCVVETPHGPVHFCNVHLRSPRQGLEQVLDRWTLVAPSRSGLLIDEIDFRRRESAEVKAWIEQFAVIHVGRICNPASAFDGANGRIANPAYMTFGPVGGERLAEPLIVAGDFNLPPESGIFRDVWGDYADAFHEAGSGFGYTKVTTKRGLTYGTRIDHVLFRSPGQFHTCRVCEDVSSDHLPLLAELRLPPAPPASP